jgi:glutaredoxin 3
MSAAHIKAQRIIDDNAVAFFSKSYCPYCRASKQLLTEMGANFYAVELDQVGTSQPFTSLWSAFLLSGTL